MEKGRNERSGYLYIWVAANLNHHIYTHPPTPLRLMDDSWEPLYFLVVVCKCSCCQQSHLSRRLIYLSLLLCSVYFSSPNFFKILFPFYVACGVLDFHRVYQVAQARLNKSGMRPLGRTQSAPLPLGHPLLQGAPHGVIPTVPLTQQQFDQYVRERQIYEQQHQHNLLKQVNTSRPDGIDWIYYNVFFCCLFFFSCVWKLANV